MLRLVVVVLVLLHDMKDKNASCYEYQIRTDYDEDHRREEERESRYGIIHRTSEGISRRQHSHTEDSDEPVGFRLLLTRIAAL